MEALLFNVASELLGAAVVALATLLVKRLVERRPGAVPASSPT
jgi:hypothetical protein